MGSFCALNLFFFKINRLSVIATMPFFILINKTLSKNVYSNQSIATCLPTTIGLWQRRKKGKSYQFCIDISML